VGLLLVGAAGWLAAEPLVNFFLKGDEAVSRDAVEFVRIAVGSLCFTGVQQCISGALRGAGNTLGAMILTIISVWVLQFPIAWYLSRHTGLGFQGIWWSFVISNVLSALLAGVWYLRGQWLKKDLAAPAGASPAPEAAAPAPA